MYPRSLYNLPSKSSIRNLKNFQFQKKLMEIYIYIFFLIALPNTEKFYTLFIFHFVHKSSLVRTICAKIFKISKISNFSPNFTLYPSLSCNLAWFILPQAFLTKAHVYFAYNTACVIPPLLPFFFISKSTTAIHQRDLWLVHVCPDIFLLQTHTCDTPCDFSELIDNIYANSFVTKILRYNKSATIGSVK